MLQYGTKHGVLRGSPSRSFPLQGVFTIRQLSLCLKEDTCIDVCPPGRVLNSTAAALLWYLHGFSTSSQVCFWDNARLPDNLRPPVEV